MGTMLTKDSSSMSLADKLRHLVFQEVFVNLNNCAFVFIVGSIGTLKIKQNSSWK